MTEYAFVITGQYPIGNGFSTFTYSGTYNANPGSTRHKALTEIMGAAKAAYEIPPAVHANVMFFSLEPNQLT